MVSAEQNKTQHSPTTAVTTIFHPVLEPHGCSEGTNLYASLIVVFATLGSTTILPAQWFQLSVA